MPRNLSVSYPNGETEYWFTERVFAPGDTVELRGSTWEVVAIGGSVDPEGDKHSTMIVREHTDGADTTAPGPAVSGPTPEPPSPDLSPEPILPSPPSEDG